MITSVLIDSDFQSLENLENRLVQNFPFLEVKGKAMDAFQGRKLISSQSPDLIFLNSTFLNDNTLKVLGQTDESLPEIVILTEERNLPLKAFHQNTLGCLSKPIQTSDLINIVHGIREKILKRKELSRNQLLVESMLKFRQPNDLIGIPTMEGYEFIAIHKILRCEGLQKCTKVITTERSDIVSSYNLGEFKRILEPFGFFLPHRSFLINLALIKRYHKEGTITMIDNHHIPVARRRKEAFLKQIRKI